ncbi:MAG: PstS family phosphate ABC transporter substrate-binding protein [Candidatus Kapaibacteriales bacterium]
MKKNSMKMNKILCLINYSSVSIFILLLFLLGCSQEEKPIQQRKIVVFCDESIAPVIKPTIDYYDSTGSLIKVDFKPTNAWNAMAKLLSREADAIIIARDYTRYEDSLLKAFNVQPHQKLTIALDALVFFVNKDNPLDTLTFNQINKFLTDKKYSLKSQYPNKLKTEPILIVNSPLSSELINLNNLVARGAGIVRPVKIFQTYDSVKSYVKQNPNAIGVGYLSHLYREPDLRPIAISFVDTAGNYIFPHNVNQPNIVRRLYPFIVEYYVFVLDRLNDNAMSFARYLYNPGYPQKYFFDIGIVPANAKITLIEE